MVCKFETNYNRLLDKGWNLGKMENGNYMKSSLMKYYKKYLAKNRWMVWCQRIHKLEKIVQGLWGDICKLINSNMFKEESEIKEYKV